MVVFISFWLVVDQNVAKAGSMHIVTASLLVNATIGPLTDVGTQNPIVSSIGLPFLEALLRKG